MQSYTYGTHKLSRGSVEFLTHITNQGVVNAPAILFGMARAIANQLPPPPPDTYGKKNEMVKDITKLCLGLKVQPHQSHMARDYTTLLNVLVTYLPIDRDQLSDITGRFYYLKYVGSYNNEYMMASHDDVVGGITGFSEQFSKDQLSMLQSSVKDFNVSFGSTMGLFYETILKA